MMRRRNPNKTLTSGCRPGRGIHVSKSRLAPPTLVAVGLALSACTSWYVQPTPAPEDVGEVSELRVTRRDGVVFTLQQPAAEGDSALSGNLAGTAGAGSPLKRVVILRTDIDHVAVKRTDYGRIGAAVLVPAGLVAGGVATLGN